MKNYNRELLVLYKTDLLNDAYLKQEVESLHQIIALTESADAFCKAHELVNRCRITEKANAILKAANNFPLKPFQFLVNTN